MAQFEVTTAARIATTVEAGGRPWGDNYDAWLLLAIPAYSALLEEALNRNLLEEERTKYFDVDGGIQKFLLYGVPIVEVDSVYSDADRSYPSTSLVAATDYVVEEEQGILKFDGTALDLGLRALKVVYTGGMGTDAADFATNFPVLSFWIDAQIAYHIGRIKSPGKTGKSAPGGSLTWEGPLDLLPNLKAEIARHRMP